MSWGGLYLVSCRRFKTAAAFSPLALNWLTVLLGPTYLVRYVLIFWFALPVLAAAVCGAPGGESAGEKKAPGHP